MSHRSEIIAALALYDEADDNKRITSGDDLLHWERQLKDAEEALEDLLDDIGTVWVARHILYSEGL